jgi:phosphate regulon transcriptional regulator PhoB
MKGSTEPTVLIVEDESALSTLLRYNLEREGYRVFEAKDGEDALLLADESKPDLVLLDWMLPQLSGIEVCRRLRGRGHMRNVPIVMLTARGEEPDRIRGLDTGADDYVVKPFSVPELMARVRALLRRASSTANHLTILRFGCVEVDFRRYAATRDGHAVEMTRKEFALLRFLASREDTVITRDELLNKVWGLDAYPVTRTVDNHIAGLRAKLEMDPGRPVHIQTVHGVGYKFVADRNP